MSLGFVVQGDHAQDSWKISCQMGLPPIEILKFFQFDFNSIIFSILFGFSLHFQAKEPPILPLVAFKVTEPESLHLWSSLPCQGKNHSCSTAEPNKGRSEHYFQSTGL